MRNKLLWFYQEVDEPEPIPPPVDVNKPGPSRAGASSSTSKTPQGTVKYSTFPEVKVSSYITLLAFQWVPEQNVNKKYLKCLLLFHRNLTFRPCHKAKKVILN